MIVTDIFEKNCKYFTLSSHKNIVLSLEFHGFIDNVEITTNLAIWIASGI